MLFEIHCKTDIDFSVFHSNKHGGLQTFCSQVHLKELMTSSKYCITQTLILVCQIKIDSVLKIVVNFNMQEMTPAQVKVPY